MCGIVGCVGLSQSHKYIIDGLKTLDYRGYDSAGVAFLNKDIEVFKEVGSISNLDLSIPSNKEGRVAIGHTRWATHGKANKVNSHPHLSFRGNFALVHNGVIENFLELKNMLKEQGISFVSDTDSEVIVNLVEYYYHFEHDVLKSINMVMNKLKGSFAIGLIHLGEDCIYVLKNASPLLIGLTDYYNLIASDASPMIEYTDRFIELDDMEYGYIDSKSYELFDINGHKVNKKLITKDIEQVRHTLNGYDHYMLKEIEEIETVIKRMKNEYCLDNGFNFDEELINKIKESDHIIFLGCGTSYHASLVGGRYFEELGVPTASYIASEWAFHPMFPGK